MNREQQLDQQMKNIHLLFAELGYEDCPVCGDECQC
jgi:uncharacterized protein (UPF0212 family)